MQQTEVQTEFLLPYAMSPTDYSYIVLGKPPNKTNVIAYINQGKMDSVRVRIEIKDDQTEEVFKTSYQNWVKVPEQERRINKEYQKNLNKVGSIGIRRMFQWVLEIDPDSLPDQPELVKQSKIHSLLSVCKKDLAKILLTQHQLNKETGTLSITTTRIIHTLRLNYASHLSPKEIKKVINWLIRHNYLEKTDQVYEKDRRVKFLQVTKEGERYFSQILNDNICQTILF